MEHVALLQDEITRLRTILCRIAREIDPCSALGPESPTEDFDALPNDIRQQLRMLPRELVR